LSALSATLRMADNPTRQEIFTQAAKKLRQDFEELTLVPHAASKGSEGEELVRKFLNSHLPGRFRAGAGFILDRKDQVSRQTDVVIYDALNCPVYRASDIASIFPNDNVAAIVEVKSKLDKAGVIDAAAKIAQAKALAKTAQPKTLGLVNTRTLGTVFAYESPLTMEKLEEHYHATLKEHLIGRHIDILMVLDRGIITLVGRPPREEWSLAMTDGPGGPEGSHFGTGIVDFGSDTLDGFFRLSLSHLVFFRHRVDHPGFQVGAGKQPLIIRYLGSVTHEKNTRKREERLKRYAEEAARELSKTPVPPQQPSF
jgi:hypothetical protein